LGESVTAEWIFDVSSTTRHSFTRSRRTTTMLSSWNDYRNSIIIPLYIGIRIWTVQRLMMADCDEVYNYWEVVAYLLYGSSSQALQTWEYAHQYALRTYAYLVPLQWTVKLLVEPIMTFVGMGLLSRVATFQLLRSIVVGLSACGELYWLLSLADNDHDDHEDDSFPVMLICTSLCGCMLPSALLPSATWMTAWCVAAASLTTGRYRWFVITCVMATLCTGWPFGAVCVVPMAVEVLRRQLRSAHSKASGGYPFEPMLRFFLFIILVTVTTQTIVMLIDRYYYGAWVAATYNIFRYNAQNANDDLYGVEPLSYYIKNLLLNLNYTGLLGFTALPVYWFTNAGGGGRNNNSSRSVTTIATLASLWPWVAITFPRPHKEERFLYPIYPVLIYGAVVAVDCIFCRFLISFLDKDSNKDTKADPVQAVQRAHRHRQWRLLFLTLFFLPSLLLSMSRTAALSKYYAAPLQIYAKVPPDTTVCVCGEWYRFPGSFYAPLQFLPSSFTGQLPQPFSMYGSRQASQAVLQPFNDQNRHEPDRYMTSLDGCDYIVDIENGDCPMGQVIASEPFLDARRTSLLHRTLYIPYFHEAAVQQQRVHYLQYRLMMAAESTVPPPPLQQVRATICRLIIVDTMLLTKMIGVIDDSSF
jgi:alpha-1,2-mannosyltransferase